MKYQMTDEQIDAEIERLRMPAYVKLAKKEENIKYQKRRVLSTLMAKEKRGMELAKKGYTFENIYNRMMNESDD